MRKVFVGPTLHAILIAVNDFFPSEIPWLDKDEKYLNGVEVGAALMLMRLGMPMVKVKINSINEDQLRVGAGAMGYHVCVDKRDGAWTHLTFATKTPQDAIDTSTQEGEDPGEKD